MDFEVTITWLEKDKGFPQTESYEIKADNWTNVVEEALKLSYLEKYFSKSKSAYIKSITRIR